MVIVNALSIPLLLLNLLGGVVSGIWLAVLRGWGVIGLGIAFFYVSVLILGFALMPSILLAAAAAYCAEKGRMPGLVFFGGLSSLYTLLLITIWCCSVMVIFAKSATATDLIPRLVLVLRRRSRTMGVHGVTRSGFRVSGLGFNALRFPRGTWLPHHNASSRFFLNYIAWSNPSIRRVHGRRTYRENHVSSPR
jgi:hypothetical protein